MTALSPRLARFVMAALAVSIAAPAAAQPAAASPTAAAAQPESPAKHKPRRHRVPNLEMDVGDGGETAERAGPTTTTDNALTTSGLSGSTGASASFVEFPPPELPQPPSIAPEQAPVIAGAPR